MGKINVVVDESEELRSKGYLRKVSSYKNGMLHGETTKWYLNGNIATRTHYRNGIKNGKQFQWNKKGQPISVYSYKDGLRNGKFKTWTNGEIETIGYMKNDKRHGILKNFHNGILRGRTGYRNGKLHGKCYGYFLTGTTIDEFTNGKITGYDGQQLWNEHTAAFGTKWSLHNKCEADYDDDDDDDDGEDDYGIYGF